MSFLHTIFGHPAIRALSSEQKREVNHLLENLVKIGQLDDYLSTSPGGQFDIRCHHVEARRIGLKLHQIGGLELMQAARAHVNRKLKAVLAEHLDYCWQNIGEWKA
ncbi:MAG: hypothetical protein GX142_06945 [Chloroflexi bacterium]|jgi:hypothetical protein|nr:hypothetical protein [Chloroflexota bacterium]